MVCDKKEARMKQDTKKEKKKAKKREHVVTPERQIKWILN